MKQLSTKFFLTAVIAITFFVISISATRSVAQTPTIINPSIGLDSADAVVSANVNGVNCDMVRCVKHNLNLLKTIVWNKQTKSGKVVCVFVEYNGIKLPIETIPDAFDADIVISDDLNNLGDIYYITVIYTDDLSDNVFIKKYTIDLTTTTYVLVGGTAVQISSGAKPCSGSRMDMFADLSISYSAQGQSARALHKYVATWMEDSSSVRIVMGAIGDVSTITPSAVFMVDTPNNYYPYPDVAAFSETNHSKDSAVFAYRDKVSLWDMTSTPIFGSSQPLYCRQPRVEAMNLNNTSGYNTRWSAVCYVTGGILVQNNMQSIYSCNSPLLKYTSNNQGFPVVAAGRGNQGISTFVGNAQYTLAWYDFGSSVQNLYSQDVNITTGLPVTNTDYYLINNYSFNDPSINFYGTGSLNSNVAISTTSNSGNGLLTAFFDGSYIVYKVTSLGTNNYGFKPTEIDEYEKTLISIYPNPATDHLMVENTTPGTVYNITDVTGRIILSGQLNAAGIINVEELANGLYLLQLNDNGSKQATRFLKQ